MAMTIAEQLYEEGYEEGFVKGWKEGWKEGREERRLAALRAVLVSRFGSQALDATCEVRLQAATAAAIDRYLHRVGVADSIAAVFAD